MAWLKEVVNDVAVQIKRGPNKDLWELKKHLRLSGSTPAPPRP
jgi:TFIIF, beta subunit HTH domain